MVDMARLLGTLVLGVVLLGACVRFGYDEDSSAGGTLDLTGAPERPGVDVSPGSDHGPDSGTDGSIDAPLDLLSIPDKPISVPDKLVPADKLLTPDKPVSLDQPVPPDVGPPSCTAKYGKAPGFVLCGETASSCVFYFLESGGGAACNSVCQAFGGSCIGAWEDTGANCQEGATYTCSTLMVDGICVCSR